MKRSLILVLAVGCGQQPAFTTTQGVNVYIEPGAEMDRDLLSLELGRVAQVAAERNLVDSADTIFSPAFELTVKAQLFPCGDLANREGCFQAHSMVPDMIYVRTEPCGISATLGHEIGHLLLYRTTGAWDFDHTDAAIFGNKDSFMAETGRELWETTKARRGAGVCG